MAVQKEKILLMWGEGLNGTQIARIMGCSKQYVNRVLAEFKKKDRPETNRIAHFEKVTFEQFKKDANGPQDFLRMRWEEIVLPERATKGSAGYDFFVPWAMTVMPHETISIPTGVRAKMEEGWMLIILPKSSLGNRHRFVLDDTIGLIDSDYYYAKNQGHIIAQMTNNSDEELFLGDGKAFMQGVFVRHGLTTNDEADGVRTGGFGSTKK